ncbi:hypothetical protein M0813_29852 [Anaeramoeba flamelloides]|uniref:Microbial-type PARG catalytic domain-containing protein n=1 Tax=Anaeramoeba flamelloides TaxID=1746091 RepID=A0ABQ8XLS0_9EUKA|nr:hypothetical protein M0813_29852 [Anaeramoeba flamelloides]
MFTINKKKKTKTEYDHEEWLEDFKMALKNSTWMGGALPSMRRNIQKQTIKCVNAFKYVSQEGLSISFDREKVIKSIQNTRMFQKMPEDVVENPNHTTEVTVLNRDCLLAAEDLINEGFEKPCVLNMANPYRPGGGYEGGAGAQEENVFRRTNYIQSLIDKENLVTEKAFSYPIPLLGAIYSPEVIVFRGAEEQGYPYLEKPFVVSFIASAAIPRPRVKMADESWELEEEEYKITKKKIRTMLKVPLIYGHDSLVLSAYGCGAFGNPASHMAKIFHEILDEEFKGYYKKIVFAIIDGKKGQLEKHGSVNPKGNFLPFFEEFKK